jgi:diguanylate cyclase (GGDEF)-like protein/PAS domain S-box-containing protein
MPNPRWPLASGGEILVVDDISDSLRLLTEVLENAGYTVRQAQDGYMALATVRVRVPDLILLDIAMPDIDGYDVCRHLKANPATRDVPVIFCSALHDTEYKMQGFARGAVDFVTKPYHPEEILVRVRTHIELYRLRAELEQRVAQRTAELELAADSLRSEISVRRSVEAQLELAAQTFEASFSGIMVTDGDGVIVAVNPAFSRMTGYTKDEALGATPRLIRSERHDEGFFKNLWQSLHEHGAWSGEIWNRRKDGNVVPMLESISGFKDEHGKVKHYIATLADMSESKDAQTLIDFLAYRDTLTGLSNRLVARKHFEQAALEAGKQAQKVAVMCLDLDRFKVINDSLGHAAGDQFLKAVATALNGVIPEHDLLSREGGDEFLVVASNIASTDGAVALATQMMQAMDKEFLIEQHALSTTTSVGIALYPDDGLNFDDLLRSADNALYQSKKKGGNAHCLFTKQLDSLAYQRMQTENCLRGAVANGELQLVYQPKLALDTGKIVGAEALVRWNSPVLGFVSPVNFIPLAEETGLILGIDEWVLMSACRQIRSWMDAGLGMYKISVNVSTLQLMRGDLNALIRRVLKESGVPASGLDLEITESVLMENIHIAMPILESLKRIGVSISLDDFGTGYSSLNYLKQLPIDTLKIDKSFVDDIHIRSRDAMIARTVIALGHNLGLNVVAEGVEHQQQFDFLREHGCNQIQGYYFSKPLPPREFENLLRTQ